MRYNDFLLANMVKNIRYVIILPGLILILGFLLQAGRVNLLALQASHLELRKPESLSAIDAHRTGRLSCRGKYFMGILFDYQAQLGTRDSEWAEAIACDKRVVVFLHRRYPEDSRLAELSAAANPDSAEAWFWLGDLTPEHAVEYYRYGLNLDPTDARRWMTLASLLEFNDPQASLDALIHACELGDPGENACLGAGNRFRSLGDIQSAINIMRKATWRGTLDNADRLEKELEAGK